MDKLTVKAEGVPALEGYVIDFTRKDNRWLYKLSLSDPDQPGKTFDCWYPEEWLARAP